MRQTRGRDQGKHTRATAARQKAVGRAEAYLRAHIDAPVTVFRLCRVVGLSERGLRNAFYGVHGVSPKRWMLAERLEGVRRALGDSAARPTTITAVATGYGFYELGRFASTYKAAFKETPSATLRDIARKTVVGQPSNAKGYADACAS